MVICDNCCGILEDENTDDPCVCENAAELTRLLADSEDMLIKMMQ
jgi:hypothetical protein